MKIFYDPHFYPENRLKKVPKYYDDNSRLLVNLREFIINSLR